MIENDEFFIYTKIYDEYYGYLKNEMKKINSGAFLIGDCYYKLLKDLRSILGDDLVTICIQPKNIQDTFDIIKKERCDYKKRIADSINEYNFLKNNEQYIDYYIYTSYNKNTDNEIFSLVVNKILNNRED